MEFSERLKNLRKKVGLTQVDVAGKLGIEPQLLPSLNLKDWVLNFVTEI